MISTDQWCFPCAPSGPDIFNAVKGALAALYLFLTVFFLYSPSFRFPFGEKRQRTATSHLYWLFFSI